MKTAWGRAHHAHLRPHPTSCCMMYRCAVLCSQWQWCYNALDLVMSMFLFAIQSLTKRANPQTRHAPSCTVVSTIDCIACQIWELGSTITHQNSMHRLASMMQRMVWSEQLDSVAQPWTWNNGFKFHMQRIGKFRNAALNHQITKFTATAPELIHSSNSEFTLLLIIVRGEGEWAVGVGLDYRSTGSPAHTNEPVY